MSRFSSSSSSHLALYYCWVILCTATITSSSSSSNILNNANNDEWVVRLEGGSEVASLLALRSGYTHVGPVLGFKDTYLWRVNNSTRFQKRGLPYAMTALKSRARIVWAEQQKARLRQKRDYLELYISEATAAVSAAAETNAHQSKSSRAFNDELWEQEWYLLDRTKSERGGKPLKRPRLDLNVLPVYRLGITGRGVKVAVLDDGLEYTHEDLRSNYEPSISYDVTDRDEDPIPRYEEPANGHGTRCAGEIAMEADNGKCGVGVAFEARIGGIKMLDGQVNDRVEAESLGYRPDLVDIYTASWGPPDDGKSLDAPGRLASEALERGILEGRQGRGSIYVWASGNGGSKADDCSCDGYVGSIYTLAIGSASQAGTFPWYGEICPATLATTYSSGAYQDQMIATTDLKNTCTTSHTGTSASAPLAAGILALALQANKNLTWRDVQHLVVYSSNYAALRRNPGWFKNSIGFWFNPRFGFGLMDAHALVLASSNWTNVPVKTICEVTSVPLIAREVSYGVTRRVQFEVVQCGGGGGGPANEIHYLEHVQVETNVEYTLRGALQMHLTSPTGTSVQLLGSRKNDNSSEGFVKWKFMSVATWGEEPKGTWYLDISDTIGPNTNKGTVGASKLILHGTKERPAYLGKSLRDYDSVYDHSDDNSNYIMDGDGTLEERLEERDNRSEENVQLDQPFVF
ncbi:neuroendocrine convertase 1-like isoform X1 [Trichogramma pretiosum]|uniref:neuroendocrine convertase 1-like isoform X1 n=1 Tax=Trichogramma pretiosum TaxID=7493 RepID=UPI0006C9C128|nr:neuroendocrine convertase 1-like isoform X1 [Trichogramma pretiosum]